MLGTVQPKINEPDNYEGDAGTNTVQTDVPVDKPVHFYQKPVTITNEQNRSLKVNNETELATPDDLDTDNAEDLKSAKVKHSTTLEYSPTLVKFCRSSS